MYIYEPMEKISTTIDFKEIDKLCALLSTNGIPHERVRHFDGWLVTYPDMENRICDVILHNFSYGKERGLLELMGFLTEEEAEYDNVVGSMTAKQVFERIKEDWDSKNNR